VPLSYWGMWRKRLIRSKKARRRTDFPLASAEAVFGFVLLVAIGVGGAQALSGAPVLASLLLPPGLMEAEAGPELHTSQVTFPIAVPESGRPFAPQVLAAGNGFPQWLQARIAVAQQAPLTGPTETPRAIPAIAIVIDDLGADAVDTQRAIALPKEMTLSFLPYPDMSPALARDGLNAGHQIIVHVPMEPQGKTDPGPMALRTGLSTAENITRLDWDLARIAGYVGINNHEGSGFTSDRAALLPVIEHLADRHVFFLDSRTSADTRVVPLARALGVPSAGRDIFLDNVQTADAINAELMEAEAVARQQGVAIAIGHPHPVTMDVLAKWTARAASDGFELVTAGDAIRLKTEHEALTDSLSASR
jgi:uncharacterized protein